MSQNDTVLDQETYDRGIAALDQYLKRTSTRYAIVRLVCNLCFMPLVAFATDFQHLGLIAAWAGVVILLEAVAAVRVFRYFKNKETVELGPDGSINGKIVSARVVSIIVYLQILVPTLLMTWAYALPGLFLWTLPQPAPIIGAMMTVVVMMNVAGQHTFKPSMSFVTAIVPAAGLLLNLHELSTDEFQPYALTFGALIIIQSVAIARAGHRSFDHMLNVMFEKDKEKLARQHADEANLAKSQFLANMSHELRTPLNAIIGYSEMMMEDAEMDARDADVEDHKRIILAGKRLLLNINDILDFSKIEAGRLDTEIGQFDLGVMVKEASDTVYPMLADKPVKLTIDLPENTPLVWSDRHRLEQCLLNLLSNAAKFTHEGDIIIRGYSEEIGGFDGFVLEVTDTGIGMTEEQLDRVFKPFSQADESFTRKYGGTGLGLVISQRLIQLLGGEISVDSTEDKGSTFRLHFPINVQSSTKGLDEDARGTQDRPVVLVIDDDADVHELLSRDLQTIGFDLHHARTAEQGLQKMRQSQPAAVVLDVHLPGKTGMELLHDVRASADLKDVPVIIHTVDSERAKFIKAGANAYLCKPASREDMVAEVVRHARHNQHPVGRASKKSKARSNTDRASA
ncbi:ATP-binding protein [Ponticaulis sp.]|uniref:ATP-binding response regulator n=1 Tax=Ponticaulis sp. TaxID=2020902 RepID=UPI0026119604|nr:ATP-binding protein [Ponticaulis sp.]MDF1678945.1 ATP-binding protein [Ponticaulis sp.]